MSAVAKPLFSQFSQEFLNSYDQKDIPWGFNGLGEIVYLRTYARTKEDGTLEHWKDTIVRCITGAQAIGAKYTQDEAERLFDHMFHLRCSFSGRALWQLGTKLGSTYGDSLNNCWVVAIRHPHDFLFLFDELQLGGGVGYSVKRADINELPRVKTNVTVRHESTKDADFIVPDSRQGFVSLLRKVLDAYFYTGESFIYSTILVRGKGEAIKGFGGKAAGPLPLIDGIDKIVKILQSREGKKLRSIDVLDIANIIGSIVISGNVRRSAQIAVGDSDDVLFLRAKRWDLGNIPNWRAFSNNTISADSVDYLTDEFWQGYNGNGEAYGLFNKKLAESYGRLGERIKDKCELPNPCAEQILESYECCNLAEIFLPNVRTLEEFTDIAILLYKTCKAITRMPYLYKQSEEVIHRNSRIGIGITGIVESVDKAEQWANNVYTLLRAFDKQWSKEIDSPQSIKLTTVKPSGTLSLLAGVTPGVHPAYAQYYIRRVRMGSEDPLVDICRSKGYTVEYARNFDGSIDYGTSVISFPAKSGSKAILAKDMSAVAQLDLVKKIQTLWSDSSVSVTVYYRKEELPAIQKWLADNYETSVKSVSFLLHSDHGFDQAPYEEISEEVYTSMIQSLSLVGSFSGDGGMLDLDDCSTGACPIR